MHTRLPGAPPEVWLADYVPCRGGEEGIRLSEAEGVAKMPGSTLSTTPVGTLATSDTVAPTGAFAFAGAPVPAGAPAPALSSDPWATLPHYVRGSAEPGLRHAERPSVRAVVLGPDGTCLLTTTDEYGEYVFPGGGVDGEESDEAALARELEEETGWLLESGSARPLLVIDDYHTRRDLGLSLCQRNRYFVCRAQPGGSMHLDAFEARTGLRPERVPLESAISRNEALLARTRLFWVERDTLVMRLLREGALG